MCWDERKSLAKSSQGNPPVPDGLAHRIIFKVPPYLGISVGVGDVVVVVAVVEVVVAGEVIVVVVVVAGDDIWEVAGVVEVVGSVQLVISMILISMNATRIHNFFIFSSLLLNVSHLNFLRMCLISHSSLTFS